MPDLTEHTAWTCDSNVDWSMKIDSSSSRGQHTVRYGRLYDPNAATEYGYTCTCKGFQFHGHCRHIVVVERRGYRCGWNAELEPTHETPKNEHGVHVCPSCRGSVSAFRVAV